MKVDKSFLNCQDYTYSLQTLYWMDSDVNSIFSSTLNGDGQKTIIVSYLIGAEDLAVDWIHNVIYWTDSNRVTISACSSGNVSKVHTVFPNIYFLSYEY